MKLPLYDCARVAAQQSLGGQLAITCGSAEVRSAMSVSLCPTQEKSAKIVWNGTRDIHFQSKLVADFKLRKKGWSSDAESTSLKAVDDTCNTHCVIIRAHVVNFAKKISEYVSLRSWHILQLRVPKHSRSDQARATPLYAVQMLLSRFKNCFNNVHRMHK